MKNHSEVPVTISALTARTQLGQIMRRAKNHDERFIVDRRGEPQVVIMGLKDFLRTVARETTVMAAIRARSRRRGTSKLTMREIEREIKAARKELRKSGGAPKRCP